MKIWLSFILVLLGVAASGRTRDHIAVGACGAITQRTGTQTDTPFLYNGAYGVVTDPNGLLHMQARYYNPNIRRFINADPSGFSGGMNFYAFAGGDPVSLIDPSGLGASPIDGSEDYDPMMEGDRVKATLANLLSFGLAEEAAVSFTGHGLLDDTQVSTAELWMTRIGFAASFIPYERVAKLASGLAGKVAAKAESFGARAAKGPGTGLGPGAMWKGEIPTKYIPGYGWTDAGYARMVRELQAGESVAVDELRVAAELRRDAFPDFTRSRYRGPLSEAPELRGTYDWHNPQKMIHPGPHQTPHVQVTSPDGQVVRIEVRK